MGVGAGAGNLISNDSAAGLYIIITLVLDGNSSVSSLEIVVAGIIIILTIIVGGVTGGDITGADQIIGIADGYEAAAAAGGGYAGEVGVTSGFHILVANFAVLGIIVTIGLIIGLDACFVASVVRNVGHTPAALAVGGVAAGRLSLIDIALHAVFNLILQTGKIIAGQGIVLRIRFIGIPVITLGSVLMSRHFPIVQGTLNFIAVRRRIVRNSLGAVLNILSLGGLVGFVVILMVGDNVIDNSFAFGGTAIVDVGDSSQSGKSQDSA